MPFGQVEHAQFYNLPNSGTHTHSHALTEGERDGEEMER